MRRLDTLSGRMAQAPAPEPAAANLDTLRAKGNAYIAEENMVEAERCFRAVLAVKSDDTKSLVCLGYVLKEQNRLSEARVALRRAIDTSQQAPDEYEMHYLLGQISEQQGDLRDAAKHFRESLRLKADFSLACKDLCRIHEMLGESNVIRGLLEQCVLLSPKCADYRVWLADVCEREIDFQGIVDHLTVAVDLGIRTADVYKTLGAALCRIGKVTEGAQTMALAEAIDPTLANETHFQVGH
jgi:tetratricopeptide (TPR) repeat protein